ncbi:MAG: leucyl aminopeptidase [Gammaproteobacteria bacterium]
MQYRIAAIDPAATKTDCLVVGVHAGSRPTGIAARVDAATGGLVARLLKQGDIKGAVKQSLVLHQPPGLQAARLVLVGLGEAGKPLSTTDANRVLAAAAGAVKSLPVNDATLLLDDVAVDGVGAAWPFREAVKAFDDATYRFDAYKSKKKDATRDKDGKKTDKRAAKAPALATLTIGLAGRAPTTAEKHAVADAAAICSGRRLARDLGNLPPNVCHPVYLAHRAQQLAKESRKLKVTVLDEQKILDLGMGAFMAVTQGSEQPGRIIAMEYRGGKPAEKPVVLVGKGITFDTGGISLKPGPGMDEMKFDMCGAATVFGVMQALVELRLPINVVGVVAAAENMPSGRASRPGDIVTTMSGQTVEILNTDAEGRLVLCDTLTWIERFKPRTVIDIATLTGACVVALGSQAHGLYSNHPPLGEALEAAGRESNDRAWPMPLWDEYQEQLDSPFADIANIGGPKAGSVTAACFLARFTKQYQWAHLDIAGTAWISAGAQKGATGRPVGLLVQYLIDEARG